MPLVTITSNADAALAALAAQPAALAEARREAMSAIALHVFNLARKYAPISPTQQQKNRMRKTNRKVRRKTNAYTRAKPGGLFRSIEWSINPDGSASVFVAANSEAGKYAKRIHDEKGQTWKNRGIGTVAKGPQADEKFIERAVFDSDGWIAEKMAKAVSRRLGS